MRIETLKEFMAIAKHRSYTKAAKTLYISQPTLSSHIVSMEKDLGFNVFVRGGTKLELTPAGRVLLEKSQTIISTFDEAVKKGILLSKKQDPVRFYAAVKGGELYKRVAELKEPEVEFVDIDYNMPLHEAVLEGHIDVCIAPQFGDIESLVFESEDTLSFIPTAGGKALIATENTHPLAARQSLSKSDLDGITVSIGSHAYFDEWKTVIEEMLGEDITVHFKLNPVESASELAREALNDAVHICGVESSKEFYSHRDDIVFFDSIDGKVLEFSSGILYRNNTHNKQIAEFVSILKEILEDLSK